MQTAAQAPAECQGAPLKFDFSATRNLQTTLASAAENRQAGGFVYLNDDGTHERQSYGDLLGDAQRVQTGLRAAGLQPGHRVILQFERQKEFITAFWGCILAGCVPVPVGVAPSYEEPNATLQKLHKAWQLLEAPTVLSSTHLHTGLRDLPQHFELPGWRVLAADALLSHPRSEDWHQAEPSDLALMMLTSGSTGTPKAVMLSHANLLARSAATTQMHGFSTADVSLNWMPLDHVAGLVYFHLRDVFIGCHQVHGPTEAVLRAPLTWMDWLDRYRVTITFAPNFAYGLVNERADELAGHSWDLSCVAHCMNGGEAIVAKTARRFVRLLQPFGLSDTAMRPAWGMSETCSAVTLSDRFSLATTRDDDPVVEVGRPIPGFSMRIVNAAGNVVSQGAKGALQVSGPSVTAGYFKNPDANGEAFTDDGWFITGDLGMIRDGQLTITGRAKDDIIINGINYLSHEIEAAVETVSGVEPSFTAACAVRRPGDHTEKLAVFFATKPDRRDEEEGIAVAIRKAVRENVGVSASFLIGMDPEDIPKTAIGKIQRTQLARRFESGALKSLLSEPAQAEASHNKVPNWFFRRKWIRWKGHTARDEARSGVDLLFVTQEELGVSVCHHLAAESRRPVRVVPGTTYREAGPEDFEIRPDHPDDYRRLLATLRDRGDFPERIVHAWTYTLPKATISTSQDLVAALATGLYSCLCLVQALATSQTQDDLEVIVVSSRARSVSQGDPIDVEKTPLLGLLRSVESEFSRIRCRHVDLEAKDPEQDLRALRDEIRLLPTDTSVAIRAGQRMVLRLERQQWDLAEAQGHPLKHGGVYVITGGLGGIGTEVARFLLERYDAQVLLLGRTPLEDPQRQGSEKAEAFAELRRISPKVLYAPVDVMDLAALESAIEGLLAKCDRPLDGIFHLAGEFAERPLAEETVAQCGLTLATKLVGTWNLHQLVRSRPDALFVSFSSANGFFGGYGVGAYAAASAFLDGFADYQRSQDLRRAYSIAWSRWDEVGMTRGRQDKALSQARGYRSMSLSDGLKSLELALAQPQTYLLIGLDPGKDNIAHYVHGEPISNLRAIVYAPDEQFCRSQDIAALLRDHSGLAIECEVRPLRDLPKAAADGATQPSAPSLEERIARIWREVLCLSHVGVNDNFFEIGGDSVGIARLAARLSELSGRKHSIAEVFGYPTVRAQATGLLGSHDDRRSRLAKSQERGERRRARYRKSRGRE